MTKAVASSYLALAAAAALVAGCLPNDKARKLEEHDAVNLDASCAPERVDPFIGKPITALPITLTGKKVRIIAPGTAVTMDYAPHRLNISTDKDGIIQGANCG